MPPLAAPTAPRPSPRSRWVVLLLLLGIAGCDQATKRAALELLPEGKRVTLLADVVRLEHAQNHGGFLGAGKGLPDGARRAIFLWGVALLTLAAAGAALSGRLPARQTVAWALVAGGGLGNLIDRATTGGWVVDFVNLGIGPLRTGIFNLADVALVAAFFLLLLPGSRKRRDRGPPEGSVPPPARP